MSDKIKKAFDFMNKAGEQIAAHLDALPTVEPLKTTRDFDFPVTKYEDTFLKKQANEIRESFELQLESANATLQEQLDVARAEAESARQRAESAEKHAQIIKSQFNTANAFLQEQLDVARAEAEDAKQQALTADKRARQANQLSIVSILIAIAAIVIPLLLAA